jgi:hypothetical protein
MLLVFIARKRLCSVSVMLWSAGNFYTPLKRRGSQKSQTLCTISTYVQSKAGRGNGNTVQSFCQLPKKFFANHQDDVCLLLSTSSCNDQNSVLFCVLFLIAAALSKNIIGKPCPYVFQWHTASMTSHHSNMT